METTTQIKVDNKKLMFQMLKAGKFGNTVPQYMSVAEWKESENYSKYPYWGVRSATISNHPACKLYCPTAEVEEYANKHFPEGANISMMIDYVCRIAAWLEIGVTERGLYMEGILNPKTDEGWTWRNSMPDPKKRKSWDLVRSVNLIINLLNGNSYQDLGILLENYPKHIIEMTVLDPDICIGTVPYRNAIIWEVRAY